MIKFCSTFFFSIIDWMSLFHELDSLLGPSWIAAVIQSVLKLKPRDLYWPTHLFISFGRLNFLLPRIFRKLIQSRTCCYHVFAAAVFIIKYKPYISLESRLESSRYNITRFRKNKNTLYHIKTSAHTTSFLSSQNFPWAAWFSRTCCSELSL